jgi:NADH-quinone oxidoreductase subunit C
MIDRATLVQRIQQQFPSVIVGDESGDLALTVGRIHLLEVAGTLRDDPELAFTFLNNLCGVDYLGREPRFEVVIHLTSMINRMRIVLHVGVPENDPTIPSLARMFPTANFQEREAYDMFGIIFTGHPRLERILMPEDWMGHPQRKDVPLGYEEVAFTHNEDWVYANKPFAKE